MLLLLCNSILNAQYYSIGQDPANIKWQQIKSENFTILYPKGFDSHSMYLANVLQYVREHGAQSLGTPPKHVTVILHNRTVESNGFSLWAPKRNEYFTCPPQDNYSQDWLEQLATHEYRHMTQMNMLNCGVTKVLGWFFGQQFNSLVLGLYIPLWFMEGDAVTTETVLTKSGRGRLPSFEMIERAQIIGYKRFNYDKAVLGSFKDYIPDRYNFGYELVAGARKLYGSDIWKSAMKTTGKDPFMVTPFNRGIKKVSGLNKTQLYKKVYDNLDSLWKIQRDQIIYTPFNSVTADKQKIYTNYKFPHYINNNDIVAEKTGLDDIERLVQINGKGGEKIIHTPGFYVFENLSISRTDADNNFNSAATDVLSKPKGLMTWAEQKVDKRWAIRDYSVIMTYDLASGKTKQITKKSRYFAPSLFPDSKKIVAVEVTQNNECSLVILNSETGEVINKIAAGGTNQFQTPSVSDDGKRIAVVLFDHNFGKSIVAIDPETGKRETLVKPSFNEVTNPRLYKNYLFFNGIYSGIDNVYAMDTISGKIWQVTSALYGAVDLDISSDGKKMAYSNYTPFGYQIAEADFNPATWKPLEQVTDNSIKLYKSLIPQETGLVDSVNIPFKNYDIKNYSKLGHLFNPHSWAPLFINANNMTLHPGISIASQNMLSTTFATIGYDYNLNEKVGRYYANVSYQGWYPVFNLTYSYGKDVAYAYQNPGEPAMKRISFNSSDFLFGTKIPLNFTAGSFIQQIRPSASIEHIATGDTLIPVNVTAMDYSIIAINQVKSVARDVLPRWEQAVSLEYKNTPFGGSNFGNIFNGELLLLFPGLARHHSFSIFCGYQTKTPGYYAFPDLLTYPRGYDKTSEFNGKLNNNNLESISVNYRLPLFYPDFRIGSLFYFQRFKANFFYDDAVGKTYSVTTNYQSTGIEL
ncbi:MAG: hypothetical protein ABR968_07645, partial [Bacteroidales bacterium]